MKRRTQNTIAVILFIILIITGSKYTGLPGSNKLICTKNQIDKNIEFNVLLGSGKLEEQHNPKRFIDQNIDYSHVSFSLLIGDLPSAGSEGHYIYFLPGSVVSTQMNSENSDIHHLVLMSRGVKSVHKFIVALYFVVLSLIAFWLSRNKKAAHNKT